MLALLALITALALAREFLVPVLMAFLLALVFSPMCRWLRRRGIPEPVSATVIVAALIGGLAAAITAFAMPISDWVQHAPDHMREIEEKLQSWSGVAEAVSDAGKEIENAADAASGSEGATEVVVREGGPMSRIAFEAPLVAAQTALVLIVLFFVLASGNLFYERLVRVMPTFADKRRALTIVYDVEREVSRYLLSITIINAGLGVAVAIALSLLGMPSPLIFGLLAFALNYVPFIGALVGAALVFSVGLVSQDTSFDAILAALTYWGLTAIEGQFITPMLVGKHLRLNTVVIIISVAFWAWLWSVMGMLMAVPLLVTFRVFCKHVPQLWAIEEFLSGPEIERRSEDQDEA
ncbi:AI-2E family transporter [Maritimibacter dapengensis]|uniref:AI-2E family transporter n=1 Tax=Maritimibacter dapengensis TaxID=2836868 RepID=A0ABS6T469_9RHOB|nr:AI-2E family transporter [Maritimibacter dapengensis]